MAGWRVRVVDNSGIGVKIAWSAVALLFNIASSLMITRFHFSPGPGFATRLLALALVAAMPACTNIRDDAARTQTEGGAAGAAGGALIGAGAGALLSKNKSQGALIGGAAGAAAGGVAGATYGNIVAQKKEGYARTEDSLDARLRGTRREIEQRHTFNNGLKYEVARHEQRLAQLRAGGRTAGLAVEQFELRSTLVKREDELGRDARSWQEAIDAHKAALERYRSDPRASALRSDIAALSQEGAELEKQRRALRGITKRAR